MKGEVLDGVLLLMAEGDTAATALEDLPEGYGIEAGDCSLELAEDVPFGHKVALVRHERGDEVRKYGEAIGRATAPIDPGDWVHTHNVESIRGRGDLAEEGSA
ncbi:MAG: UxaA family hydrolase [Halobacteriales archaeon]